MTKKFCNLCNKELMPYQVKNYYDTNVYINEAKIYIKLSAKVISVGHFVPTNWEDNVLCANCFLRIIQKASKLKNINKFGEDKIL